MAMANCSVNPAPNLTTYITTCLLSFQTTKQAGRQYIYPSTYLQTCLQTCRNTHLPTYGLTYLITYILLYKILPKILHVIWHQKPSLLYNDHKYGVHVHYFCYESVIWIPVLFDGAYSNCSDAAVVLRCYRL